MAKNADIDDKNSLDRSGCEITLPLEGQKYITTSNLVDTWMVGSD